MKILGWLYEHIVGKTLRELGYEDWHAEMHHQEIEVVRAPKKPIRGEVAFKDAFGRRLYDYIFAPVFDSTGEGGAVAGTTRDVTDSHHTQDVLKQEADLRKDEFLAMLAHKSRNPLAPTSAATQIMMLSNVEESRVRKSSRLIERQVKHMVGLMDDLLDVSRVTRGLANIEKLSQSKRCVDYAQGGLGIGMAVMKSLLKLHDGTVSCFSEG